MWLCFFQEICLSSLAKQLLAGVQHAQCVLLRRPLLGSWSAQGPFADPIFRHWAQRAQWLDGNIHNPSSLIAVPAPVTAARAAPLRGHHFCSSSCPLVVDPHAGPMPSPGREMLEGTPRARGHERRMQRMHSGIDGLRVTQHLSFSRYTRPPCWYTATPCVILARLREVLQPM